MKFFVALALLALASFARASKWEKPSFCGKHDCPIYSVTYSDDDFETRTYANSTWMVAPVCPHGSMFESVAEARARLLRYFFDGYNEANETVTPGVPFVTHAMRVPPPHHRHGRHGKGLTLAVEAASQAVGSFLGRVRDALGFGGSALPNDELKLSDESMLDFAREGRSEAVEHRVERRGAHHEGRHRHRSKGDRRLSEDGGAAAESAPELFGAFEKSLSEAMRARFVEGSDDLSAICASFPGPHPVPHLGRHHPPRGPPRLAVAAYLPYKYQSIDGAEPEAETPVPVNHSGVFVVHLPEMHVQASSFGGFASPRSFFHELRHLMRSTRKADQPADPFLGVALAIYDGPTVVEDRHNEVLVAAHRPHKKKCGKKDGKKHRKDTAAKKSKKDDSKKADRAFKKEALEQLAGAFAGFTADM